MHCEKEQRTKKQIRFDNWLCSKSPDNTNSKGYVKAFKRLGSYQGARLLQHASHKLQRRLGKAEVEAQYADSFDENLIQGDPTDWDLDQVEAEVDVYMVSDEGYCYAKVEEPDDFDMPWEDSLERSFDLCEDDPVFKTQYMGLNQPPEMKEVRWNYKYEGD